MQTIIDMVRDAWGGLVAFIGVVSGIIIAWLSNRPKDKQTLSAAEQAFRADLLAERVERERVLKGQDDKIDALYRHLRAVERHIYLLEGMMAQHGIDVPERPKELVVSV